MDTSKTGLSAADAELLCLGADLGQDQALGHVRGICGAARASIYSRLREQKLYKRFNYTWEEFCDAVLNHSRADVDRQIALLNEFGPRYFAVSELAPVSPENFRLIETSVQENALIFDGESIPLVRENAQKVAHAVAILRRRARTAAAPPQPNSVFAEVKALHRRAQSMIASFTALSKKTQNGEGWIEFIDVLKDTQTELTRVEMEAVIDSTR